jgi:hypothetical protein
MSIIDYEEEEKKNKVEYPKFRLIQGGKEPPEHEDYWLKDLEEHAVFVAREKKGTVRWIASEYHIRVKIGDAFHVMLKQWDPEKNRERVHFSWIVGPDFSKDWDCIEVLDDGKSYRTDNEEGLEDSEDTVGGGRGSDPVDQDAGQEIVRGEFGDKPIDLK